MRRLITIIYIVNIVSLSFFTTDVYAGDKDIGCCKKTEIANPAAVTTMPSTKADCDLTGQQGPWSVEFDVNLVARGNQCVERPTTEERQAVDPLSIVPAVSIPGTDFISGKSVEVKESTATLATYIVAIFKYSIGVIGIIAAIALMIGGILWLSAAGNQEQIGNAKKMIASSIMGMVLAFTSFTILSMINTNLVNFKINKVPTKPFIDIAQDGCCLKGVSTDTKTSEDLTEVACAAIPDTTFFAGLKALNNDCSAPTLKYFKACGDGVDKNTVCAAFSGAKAVEDKYCTRLPDAPRCSSEQVCCSNTEPGKSCGNDKATCPTGDGYCMGGICLPCKSKGDSCTFWEECANEEGKCGGSSHRQMCFSYEPEAPDLAICDFSPYY